MKKRRLPKMYIWWNNLSNEMRTDFVIKSCIEKDYEYDTLTIEEVGICYKISRKL